MFDGSVLGEMGTFSFPLMSLVARKPVLGVSDKTSFKPVSSATDASQKIEISHVANLHMILFKKRITKALIRLRVCAGWSAPVLFANSLRQIFSRRGPNFYVYVFWVDKVASMQA